MAFDIFNPPVSKIAAGIDGKCILIYGGNKCGKTHVMAHMPKPFFFAFELGLEALNGVPYFHPTSWYAFDSVLDQLIKQADKTKQVYQTIVFDQIEAMGATLVKTICDEAGVKSLDDKPVLPSGKVDGWWNGYTQLTKRMNDIVAKFRMLMNNGLTLAFIAHEGTRKLNDQKLGEYEKGYPRGDKRVVDPIVDLASFIGYVASNGIDENGKVIKSSLYLSDCKERLGGGRFTTATTYLPTFTADSFIAAIDEATEAEAVAVGAELVTNKEVVSEREAATLLTFEEAKDAITSIAKKVYEGAAPRYGEIDAIVKKWLGAGKTISKDATEADTDKLCSIYVELKKYVEEDADLSKLFS